MIKKIELNVSQLVSVLIISSAFCTALQAQVRQPINWHFTSVPIGDKKAKLIFTANLEDGWHIYSQFLEEGGPLPTSFTFIPDGSYSLRGKVKEESTPFISIDNVFMTEVVWFNNTAVFTQEVILYAPITKVKGNIEFMGCNNFMCLPPNEVEFSVEVKAAKQGKNNKGK